MTVGSDKFYIELCAKTKCDPGNKRCYCCKTVPVERCFWGQQECWDYCPNRQHYASAPSSLHRRRGQSSIIDEPHGSINSRVVPDSTSLGENL
ncbi:hypothetical protein HU200_040659 [Digitaria exilis]|uniref:Uncharacterized protein n=1 Tax=Digitaria exilis TaxID=1010633 RepID=A0A835BH27_9POAL|nr:hypothetical protein HU200_040659 [Digitaria exilis]